MKKALPSTVASLLTGQASPRTVASLPTGQAGIIRRSSSFNTGRIDHLFNNPEIYGKRLFLHYGDLTDSSNLNRLLEKTEPDEIYPEGMSST